MNAKGLILLVCTGILVLTNLISFFLMMHDKKCARKGRWRVPEKRLFLAAACFGALGGVLGMQLLRHKTKHWYFRWGFPALLIVQMLLIAAGVRLL